MSIYRFKTGSHIRANAQEAAKVFAELEAKNNLTAEGLVEASRPEDAPLHNEFQWDDTIAAEEWRKHQARRIIAALEIVTEKKEPIRAYYNIVVSEPQYRHIETIMQTEEGSEMLLRRALFELKAFQKKYVGIKQKLQGVFDEIDKLEVSA